MLILVLFSISNKMVLAPAPANVSLSKIVKEINEGRITKLEITEDKIRAFSKDGKILLSSKEAGTSALELLERAGATESSLRSLEIEIKGQSFGWQEIFSLLLYLLPFLLFIGFLWWSVQQSRSGAMQVFDFTRAKARLFGSVPSQERVTFDDVAGLDEVKEELQEIVSFLKNPQRFLRVGARIPRGVLLIGAPGTGKTLLARAVATEAGVPFFSISGSEFMELFVGVGASRVRSLFTQAKKAGRAIIFIDEIDTIGKVRGLGIGGGHEEREQTLNQILAEMDGFEREDAVIVMGATNRPDVLDPALLRPGRFDRRIVLPMPDLKAREEILKIHSKNKPLGRGVDLREIAERTPGFSGADLENVVNEAAILAVRKSREEIWQEDLLEGIEKVLLGPARKSNLLSDKEKEIAAYHEAGHALVSHFLAKEPVRKISVVSRGVAAGYTLKAPTEERKFKRESELKNEIAVLLGGYCAEEIVFGEITTGAGSDLKEASEIARRLVKEYGMSSLGPVVFGQREDNTFLPKESIEIKNYSERMAELIDQEIRKIIEEQRRKVKKLLKEKRKILDRVASELLKKETIEREEFEKLVESKVKSRKRKKERP